MTFSTLIRNTSALLLALALPAHAAPKTAAWEPPATKAQADEILKSNAKKCIEWAGLMQTYVIKDTMSPEEKQLYRELEAAQKETVSLCQDQESFDKAISERLKELEAEKKRVKKHEDALSSTKNSCYTNSMPITEIETAAMLNGVTIAVSGITTVAGGISIWQNIDQRKAGSKFVLIGGSSRKSKTYESPFVVMGAPVLSSTAVPAKSIDKNTTSINIERMSTEIRSDQETVVAPPAVNPYGQHGTVYFKPDDPNQTIGATATQVGMSEKDALAMYKKNNPDDANATWEEIKDRKISEYPAFNVNDLSTIPAMKDGTMLPAGSASHIDMNVQLLPSQTRDETGKIISRCTSTCPDEQECMTMGGGQWMCGIKPSPSGQGTTTTPAAAVPAAAAADAGNPIPPPAEKPNLDLLKGKKSSTLNKAMAIAGTATALTSNITQGIAAFATDFGSMKSKINGCLNTLKLTADK